jgi:hypothetical protein
MVMGALNWNPEIMIHNQQIFMQEQVKNEPQQSEQLNQQTIIDNTLAKLDDDIVAWYTSEFIHALHHVYDNNQQQYKRIYHKLKKWKIASEVDKEIKLFAKRRHQLKNPTLPALSTLSVLSEDLNNLHQSNTILTFKPIIKTMQQGDLVVYEDEGSPSLVIESTGAVILANYLRGAVAYSLQAKTWHLFTGAHWRISDDKLVDIILIEQLYIGSAELGFRNTILRL